MRRLVATFLVLGVLLAGCQVLASPTATAPARDAPFPPTWTPTSAAEDTPTATLVVQPTPTWDGTPPPPSEAFVPRMLPAQLYRTLEGEEAVTAVDVRTLAAYEQAHVPGALHIPLEELAERVGELDGNDTIVFYDLSLNEAMSLEAAMILYGVGFTKVAVLDGGMQKWYADGYAIEGTWLTPTPRYVGPPWTVTPITTSISISLPTTVVTATLAQGTGTPAPTATMAK
jgi:rhodanese-related sulfurtransferase